MSSKKRALLAGAGSLMDLSGRGTVRAARSAVSARYRSRGGVGGDWRAVGKDITKAAGRATPTASSKSKGRKTGA